MKVNMITQILATSLLIAGILSCQTDGDARNHLKFVDQPGIVIKNLIRMDSLIKELKPGNQFRSCYMEQRDGHLTIYINKKPIIHQTHSDTTYYIPLTSLKELREDFLKTANFLRRNKISLIVNPCGFMEFVFHYSSDRGKYRSIVIKTSNLSDEVLKTCMRTKIDSTRQLWLLKD